MSVTDRDPIGLYKLSLGNLGYNSVDELNYPCNSGYGVTDNSTCLEVFGTQITTEQAGEIITAFEFLQIIAFLSTLLFLRTKSDLVSKDAQSKDCVISDYAIMVTRIPPDTTITQIITHFTNLYQLKESDWRNRPPLANAQVVTNTQNIQSLDAPIHINTWIAEATICRKYGMFIRSFREEADLMTSLIRARAFMKMYKADTPHAKGYNEIMYKKWENKWGRYSAEIDRLTTKLVRRSHSTSKGKSVGGNVKEQNSKGKLTELADVLDADAVAAVVVFNYSESMARCVEDYQSYSRFPWSLCYPSRMKFRGTRINVRKAPEPDEIIWENLEVPTSTKYYRRLRTTFITLLFLAAGFMFIIQAAVEKNAFKKQLPMDYLCKTELPALYKGTYKGISGTSLQRPSVATDANGVTRASYDSQCKVVIPGSFYLLAAENNDPSKPVGRYAIAACTKKTLTQRANTYGQCPHYNQTVFCPCHTIDASETCPQTLACETEAIDGRCESFSSGLIGGCYCYSQILVRLQALLTPSGIASGLAYDASDPCYTFFQSFALNIGLTYGAAFATVITNMILRWIIFKSAKSEYYNSFDRENGSIIQKLFLVLYLNMGVVCLFAFGYYINSPSNLAMTGILQGSFVDFTNAWYGQVGEFLIITFVANALSPLYMELAQYLIILPLKRWREVKKVENLSSNNYAMQADLNELFIGPIFTSTGHSAHLLALVFLVMTYAPSLPILNCLLCATFYLFFNIDKRLLCRYYQRPAYLSDGAYRIIISLLPYAAVVRLCMACWMYGNNDVVPSEAVNVGFIPAYSSANPAQAQSLYQSYLATHSNDHSLQFLVVSKIVRLNVFPLFVLLMIIVAAKVIVWVLQYVPLEWIYEHIILVYRKICTPNAVHAVSKIKREDGYLYGQDMVKLNDPLRQEMAPYTGPYYKFVRFTDQQSTRLQRFLMRLGLAAQDITKEEEEKGWELCTIEDYVAKVKKSKGREKLTFEIIGERSCSSYAIERIPAYATAMHGLKEGITNLDPEMQNGPLTTPSAFTSRDRSPSSRVKKMKSTDPFNASKGSNNSRGNRFGEEPLSPKSISDDGSMSASKPNRTPNIPTDRSSATLSESDGNRYDRNRRDLPENVHVSYFPSKSGKGKKSRYDKYDDDEEEVEDEEEEEEYSRSRAAKKGKKAASRSKSKSKGKHHKSFDSVGSDDDNDDDGVDDDGEYDDEEEEDEKEGDSDEGADIGELVHPMPAQKKKGKSSPAKKTAKVSPQKKGRVGRSKSKGKGKGKKEKRDSHDAEIPDDWRAGVGGLM